MAKIVEDASKETKKARRLKQKESIRARESIPQMAEVSRSVEKIYFADTDDMDFDIQPFEDVEE